MSTSSMESSQGGSGSTSMLLTLPEVARRLNFSLRKMQQEVAMGRIVVVRFGRSVRVHPSDLRAYLDACRGLAPGESPPEARVEPLPEGECVSTTPGSPAGRTVSRRKPGDLPGPAPRAQ